MKELTSQDKYMQKMRRLGVVKNETWQRIEDYKYTYRIKTMDEIINSLLDKFELYNATINAKYTINVDPSINIEVI